MAPPWSDLWSGSASCNPESGPATAPALGVRQAAFVFRCLAATGGDGEAKNLNIPMRAQRQGSRTHVLMSASINDVSLAVAKGSMVADGADEYDGLELLTK